MPQHRRSQRLKHKGGGRILCVQEVVTNFIEITVYIKWVTTSLSYCSKLLHKMGHYFLDTQYSTVCLRSRDPFYVVTFYIIWVTTSWTHSSIYCT